MKEGERDGAWGWGEGKFILSGGRLRRGESRWRRRRRKRKKREVSQEEGLHSFGAWSLSPNTKTAYSLHADVKMIRSGLLLLLLLFIIIIIKPSPIPPPT